MIKDLEPGSKFDGRYKILAKIGAGGMGCVLKAEDLQLNRIVAIKVLHQSSILDKDSDAKERFIREGRALSILKHKNIVLVNRIGIWQEQFPFLDMEYVQGCTLRTILNNEGTIVWPDALRYVSQICDGLAVAHEAGIIHRDIKPENILISGDGLDTPIKIKIADFGLCRIFLPDHKEQLKLTATGLLIGTVNYLPPETGKRDSISPAMDIYSLACLLHEMLTGNPPFSADTPIGTIWKHCNEPAPRLSNSCPNYKWPANLEQLLQSCLAKNPEERPAIEAIQLQIQELLEQAKYDHTVPPVNRPSGKPIRSAEKTLLRKILFIFLAITVTYFSFLGLASLRHSKANPISSLSNVSSDISSKATGHLQHKVVSGSSLMIRLGQLRIQSKNVQKRLQAHKMKSDEDELKKLQSRMNELQEATVNNGDKLCILVLKADSFANDFENQRLTLLEALKLCRIDKVRYLDEIFLLTRLADAEKSLGKTAQAKENLFEILSLTDRFRRSIDAGEEIPTLSDEFIDQQKSSEVCEKAAKSKLADLLYDSGDLKESAKLLLQMAKVELEQQNLNTAVHDYIRYANCQLKMKQPRQAYQALEYCASFIPGPGDVEGEGLTGQQIGAYNSLDCYENLRDWFKAHQFQDLAKKYDRKAVAIIQHYHLGSAKR